MGKDGEVISKDMKRQNKVWKRRRRRRGGGSVCVQNDCRHICSMRAAVF